VWHYDSATHTQHLSLDSTIPKWRNRTVSIEYGLFTLLTAVCITPSPPSRGYGPAITAFAARQSNVCQARISNGSYICFILGPISAHKSSSTNEDHFAQYFKVSSWSRSFPEMSSWCKFWYESEIRERNDGGTERH